MSDFNRQYPNGRVSGDDDGQTKIGMAVDRDAGVLYVRFTKRVEWLGLDADSAMQFLTTFAKHASALIGMPITVSVGDDKDDDYDPIVLYDPVDGAIRDSQLRQICDDVVGVDRP
jgi:hypothetical protein